MIYNNGLDKWGFVLTSNVTQAVGVYFKYEKEQAVLIHWNDSISTYGWKDRDVTENFDLGVQTIGWLIQDSPDSYVITAHAAIDGTVIDSPMKIPKSAVTGFWEIELK